MKKNKFIPLAVLAGLCFVGFAMNNQRCAAKQNKPDSACTTTKECKKQEVDAKNGKTPKPLKCKKNGRCKKNKTQQ